jgi:hypothetical protein
LLRQLGQSGDVSKHDVDDFMSKAVGFYDSCLG